MSIKSLTIDKVEFSDGLVIKLDALAKTDQQVPLLYLVIYVEHLDKNISIMLTKLDSGTPVKLTLRLAGKILRLVKEYDKLGKKSIGL